MINKNRFSILLEQLLNTAEIKQYVLAKHLNYDTSYISKWLTGRMLPGEKGVDDVLHSISDCIIENGSQEGLQQIAAGYQIRDISELGSAIYDQLVIEYNYVMSISNLTGYDVAPELIMFPEVSAADFIRRMKHPILRRVTNLKIVAAADIMALSKEYQLEFTNLRMEAKEAQREYPNVHFNLVIDLHHEDKGPAMSRIQLITNLMIKMAHISFNIYGSNFALGKLIFAVRDEFSISGMLNGSDRCISVVMCEGEKHSTDIYRIVREICTNDNLYFLRKDVKEMIMTREYLHMLLSPGQCWLMGRLSEYLIPEDLFGELLEQYPVADENMSNASLKKIGALLNGVRKSNPIRIIIHESALLEFTLNGSVDFLHTHVDLDYDQRRRILEYLLELFEYKNVEIQMVHGLLPDQAEFLTLPTLQISDTGTYLKVFSNNLHESNMFQINRPELAAMYQKYFEEVWNYDSGVVINDMNYIRNYINQLLINNQLLSFT